MIRASNYGSIPPSACWDVSFLVLSKIAQAQEISWFFLLQVAMEKHHFDREIIDLFMGNLSLGLRALELGKAVKKL